MKTSNYKMQMKNNSSNSPRSSILSNVKKNLDQIKANRYHTQDQIWKPNLAMASIINHQFNKGLRHQYSGKASKRTMDNPSFLTDFQACKTQAQNHSYSSIKSKGIVYIPLMNQTSRGQQLANKIQITSRCKWHQGRATKTNNSQSQHRITCSLQGSSYLKFDAKKMTLIWQHKIPQNSIKYELQNLYNKHKCGEMTTQDKFWGSKEVKEIGNMRASRKFRDFH